MSESVNGPVTLTRAQLHELVWSEPMRRLAPRFGLSNVGLAKVCKRHMVPYPKRGYWAKFAAGQNPRKIDLPTISAKSLDRINFRQFLPAKSETRSDVPPQPLIPFDPDVLEVIEKARSAPKISLAEDFRGLHPVVRATRDAIQGLKPNDRGMVSPPYPEQKTLLDVSVSPANLKRSILLLDAVVKAVGRLGGSVEPVETCDGTRTRVVLCGEQVALIRLRERYRQVKRPKNHKKLFWCRYDYIPTGRLTLGSSRSTTVYAQDSESEKLIEPRLNEVIIGWVEEAGRVRFARRKAEEERHRKEEEERLRRERVAAETRRRAEEEARKKAERERVERLIGEARSWNESRLLREYIGEVHRRLIERHGVIEEGSEAAHWLAWAGEQADRLDPFVQGPHSVLDESRTRLEGQNKVEALLFK
jgi:hypothetical protein